MKRLVITAAVMAACAAPAFAADVGVSISIGEPGFYGRLDIGGYPPPQVIYRQPVTIEAVPVDRPIVYLRVPPGHAKHWRKYCGRYHACGERVMFVRDDWYQREYAPRYHERHEGRGERREAEHREMRREEYRDERRDERHDERGDEHHHDHRDDRGRDR